MTAALAGAMAGVQDIRRLFGKGEINYLSIMPTCIAIRYKKVHVLACIFISAIINLMILFTILQEVFNYIANLGANEFKVSSFNLN